MENRAHRRKTIRAGRMNPKGCFGSCKNTPEGYDPAKQREHVSNRKVIKRLRKTDQALKEESERL